MKRWYILTTLLWSLGAMEPSAFADEAGEYRAITLIDGSLQRGRVVGTDADSIRLKTLKGEVALPLLDIEKVEPISREVYLLLEGRRLLYLGVTAVPAQQEKARQIDAVMRKALEREDLLVLTSADLPADRRARLEACADLDCKLGSLRGEGLMAVHGQLEVRDQHTLVTFRRFDRTQAQVGEVTLPIESPPQAEERLARGAALLLGETPPSSPATEPSRRPQTEVATAPEQAAGTTPPAPADQPPASGTGAPAWQLDLIPVPAASSLLHYENATNVVVSAGVIAAITGTTVYMFGDSRRFGSREAIHVPWSFDDRATRDAVLLTGVGVASYVATTWIVNQVVRRIQVSRPDRTHANR